MRTLIASLKTITVAATEGGEPIATVVATQELNGCAVWFHHRNHDPRMLAWHGFSPSRHTAGVVAAAHVHAERIAKEAINHGMDFAAIRKFEQC